MSDLGTIVVEIYVAPVAGARMVRVEAVEAIAGTGLAGDRYAARGGTFSNWPRDHELTLIEAEAVAQIAGAAGAAIDAADLRRNLVVRGVSLNEWVGRGFTIGQVRCRGTRLCHPCAHLQRLVGVGGLVEAMTDRGGLRAVIVDGGVIREGDGVRAE